MAMVVTKTSKNAAVLARPTATGQFVAGALTKSSAQGTTTSAGATRDIPFVTVAGKTNIVAPVQVSSSYTNKQGVTTKGVTLVGKSARQDGLGIGHPSSGTGNISDKILPDGNTSAGSDPIGSPNSSSGGAGQLTSSDLAKSNIFDTPTSQLFSFGGLGNINPLVWVAVAGVALYAFSR